MKATRILSTGALAVSLTLGTLSVRSSADTQASVGGEVHKSMQGAEQKCGSGNCGATKPDDQSDKKAAEKKMNEKNARSKGATQSCGASKCG